MAPVQLLVGGVVARAHPADQVGVTGRQLDRRRQDAVLAAVALGRDAALHRVCADRRAARPAPWLGTWGDARPPASASPSPCDSSRPSTPIAESPRRLPTSHEHRVSVPYWLLVRTRLCGASTRPWGFAAPQY